MMRAMSSPADGRLHRARRSVAPGREDLAMSAPTTDDATDRVAVPPVVDQPAWEAALAALRTREKAATRELDAIAAARRRLPMVELPGRSPASSPGSSSSRPTTPASSSSPRARSTRPSRTAIGSATG
jgi:hypothetical protein